MSRKRAQKRDDMDLRRDLPPPTTDDPDSRVIRREFMEDADEPWRSFVREFTRLARLTDDLPSVYDDFEAIASDMLQSCLEDSQDDLPVWKRQPHQEVSNPFAALVWMLALRQLLIESGELSSSFDWIDLTSRAETRDQKRTLQLKIGLEVLKQRIRDGELRPTVAGDLVHCVKTFLDRQTPSMEELQRGWTLDELCRYAGISPQTFRRIRAKTDIETPPPGRPGQGRRYSKPELRQMIDATDKKSTTGTLVRRGWASLLDE